MPKKTKIPSKNLTAEGYRKGNFDPEQEKIWAKEKAECLERHYERIIEAGAKWLHEVRLSHKKRDIRIQKIREKYGQDLLVKILRRYGSWRKK